MANIKKPKKRVYYYYTVLSNVKDDLILFLNSQFIAYEQAQDNTTYIFKLLCSKSEYNLIVDFLDKHYQELIA